MVFLSIFAATCRPNNVILFLNNLKETCDDPTSFEVLLKIDENDEKLITFIEEYKKTSDLNIKYLATEKLDGYYSLDVGYNELLKIADPNTYFCWLLTDEIRLETKGWDTILQKYIGLYKDNIFRLKMSIFALKNYHDFFECLPCPDNYAVTTRKWLEIAGGWGHFWGPDSWHQCIDYYLSLCKNKSNPYGIWRSIPIFDIKVGGQEAGQGIVDEKALLIREKKIHAGWKKFSSHSAQENYYKLAQRLNCHIIAMEMELNQYMIQENYADKTVSLCNIDDKKILSTFTYKLSRFNLSLLIGHCTFNINNAFTLKKNVFLRQTKRNIIKICRDFYNHFKQLMRRIIHALKIITLSRKIFKKLKTYYKNFSRSQKTLDNESMRYIYDGKYLKPVE